MLPIDLHNQALGLLGRREYTVTELRRRLTPLAPSAEDLEALLAQLSEQGLLSDVRAAEAITRSRARRQGSLRIEQELRRRGVSPELAQDTLAQTREAELDTARQLLLKKFPTAPASAEERARQGRYLQNRGFPLAIIQKILRGQD